MSALRLPRRLPGLLAVLFLTLLSLTPLLAAEAAPPVSAAPMAHLALEVELDPDSRHLRVRATLTPAERDFRFVLHESLRVDQAAVDGRPVTTNVVGRTGSQRRWLARLPAAGATLRIEYQGSLPALDSRLDHRDVLRPLPPMAAIEGSFLPASSAWYPQVAELFSYRVRVSVPGDQRALVAGRLIDEALPATAHDRYRADFEFVHPADGIDLMAGPWIVRERTVPRDGEPPLRLRTYFTRALDGIDGLADSYLNETEAHIAHYAREIGAYPFSGFSVVASPLPTGLGMPTLTYLGEQVLRLPFIRATSLRHEVLHNWWGNGVYVDYAQGNWAEGLTTFMADYAFQARASADGARAMRLGWLRDFAALPPGKRQSLASFRSRTHGAAAAVGYGKAAMLFVMLRDRLGEAHFQAGLRLFWQEQRFRVASWADLQAAFERTSGQALETFFRQWLLRDGAPELRITTAAAGRVEGKLVLHVGLAQSAPAYRLRVPLQLNFGDGAEEHSVELDQDQQTATLVLDRLPASVVLDPQLRLWRSLDARQLPPILRQWIVAHEPVLLQVSAPAEVRRAATTLATRLFEARPREITLRQLPQATAPVLLVGLHPDVDAALAASGLPARLQAPGEHGSALVWTIAERRGAPVAVISARDAAALDALQRPLAHYGSQSWLVFDGPRVLARGVWPIREMAVPVQETTAARPEPARGS